MLQSNFLRIVLLLSIITIALFPLYTVFYQYPAFYGLLKENLANDAMHMATHLSSIFDKEEGELHGGSFTPDLLSRIKSLQDDSHFTKLKIYSPSGDILYSSDPKEIGTSIKGYPYFRDIVVTGRPFTKEIRKNTRSLEDEVMRVDVVETYVPIMKGDRTIGVFEIYYDITDKKQEMDNLIVRSSGILFVMAFILLAAVVISTMKANRFIKERATVEKERERLIGELQDALFRIKTLSGLLPICAWCKKIRDDKGYWNQLEAYISEHSEAEFSHGICPECRKQLHPTSSAKRG